MATSRQTIIDYLTKKNQFVDIDQVQNSMLQDAFNDIHAVNSDDNFYYFYDIANQKLIPGDQINSWFNQSVLADFIKHMGLIGYLRFSQPLFRIIQIRLAKSNTGTDYLAINSRISKGIYDGRLSLTPTYTSCLWWLDTDRLYNGHKIELRINDLMDDIDKLDQSPILGLSKFKQVREFLEEQAVNDYPKLNLTYSKIMSMGDKPRKKIICSNWKKIGELKNINLDQFSLVELVALSQLKAKVTDVELQRVVKYLSNNHSKVLFTAPGKYWLDLYTSYILDYFQCKQPQLKPGQVIFNQHACQIYCQMMFTLRKKMEINFNTWDELQVASDQMMLEAEVAKMLKHLGISKRALKGETFSSDGRWKLLRQRVPHIYGLSWLDTFTKLKQVSDYQHNYVKDLPRTRKNEIAIFMYKKQGERYIVEVRGPKDHQHIDYHIIHMISMSGNIVKQQLVKDLDVELNTSIL